MSRPIFSVMIPIYNCEKEIERLMDSIVEQGWDKDRLEVICCDDNSTDNTMELIHKYDDRLNIVYCGTSPREVHCPGNTRKDALAHVSGEWLTSIDDDDAFEPGAFDAVWNHICTTGEDMMVCANFKEYKNGETREFHGDETWTHGKWFNMDNLVKKFNIDYRENMESHEDLYFNSLVLGHLIGNNRDYNYCDAFVYKWIYRPTSLSRSYYNEKYNYIETYLSDYLDACALPYFELIKVYPDAFGFFYNQLMMCILHGYFYYQASVYRIGRDHEILEANRRRIADIVNNMKEKLNISKEEIINYIYSYPQRYMNIKNKCFLGSNWFIETESLSDFIMSL